jgi:hypothetical protein
MERPECCIVKKRREEVLNLNNEIIKFYGLLGLSEPILEDEVTGRLVSFKLNQSELKAIFHNVEEAELTKLIDSAEHFFREDEEAFYKDSRWSNSAILKHVNVERLLTGCRTKTDKEIVQ